MKVLWIVNTVFPAPSSAMGYSEPISGGWMYGLAEKISKSEGFELAVATVYSETKLKIFTFDKIDYFLLPCRNKIKYDRRLEGYWNEVYLKFKPDIIHIHGTEFPHGLACMRKFPKLNYILSIQGLVYNCSKYYLGGLSFYEVLKSMTFRDIVRFDNLFQARKQFERRGRFEREFFIRTNHVIGRTQWDLVHSKKYNSKVKYHFCNESLRDNFYEAEKWNLTTKKNFSIFCSQAIYPLKGLHQVLKAVALLKQDFPEIKLKIAGKDITKRDIFIDKIKISGYGFYLNKIIRKFGIEELVEFTGPLDKSEMIKQYQEAHIFICSSSIENSPNSLGEAQLIGVPTIATYVGGIPNMIEEGVSGLMYRFEEYEMLAENIRLIFSDDSLAVRLSENGIASASKRHDREINLKRTIDIYNLINAIAVI
jgi:glycosyltransferase involved in cell wall biosynthesis